MIFWKKGCSFYDSKFWKKKTQTKTMRLRNGCKINKRRKPETDTVQAISWSKPQHTQNTLKMHIWHNWTKLPRWFWLHYDVQCRRNPLLIRIMHARLHKRIWNDRSSHRFKQTNRQKAYHWVWSGDANNFLPLWRWTPSISFVRFTMSAYIK